MFDRFRSRARGLMLKVAIALAGMKTATVDAARTTPENRRHWQNADTCSADAAFNPSVRAILRSRGRHEAVNSAFLAGMKHTDANHVVGTGPRPQLNTPNSALNRIVEKRFLKWAKAVNLSQKLRLMRMARVIDGESFAILTNNPSLASEVKLDLRVIEADQVQSPLDKQVLAGQSDGIDFDEYGNPVAYWIMRHHPGDNRARLGGSSEFDRVDAKYVIHYFSPERAGQTRGIPEVTSSIPRFAEWRRYTDSVISAADTAAKHAAVLKTQGLPDGESAGGEDLPQIEIERNMLTVLPDGYDITQLKAEQPTTTLEMFKEQLLGEAGRPLSQPLNVATCNSSKYNYASGRLDHQTWFKYIEIRRDEIELTIASRVMYAWLQEAMLIPGFLPTEIRSIELDYEWYWDGQPHVDPEKEANAQTTRLTSGMTSYAAEYAAQGKDWEREFEQLAIERKAMDRLGLKFEPVMAPQASDNAKQAA